MGLDWSHPEESTKQHLLASSEVESPREVSRGHPKNSWRRDTYAGLKLIGYTLEKM